MFNKFIQQLNRDKQKAINRRRAEENPKIYPPAPKIDCTNLKADEFEFLLKRSQYEDYEFADEFNLTTSADWLKVLTPDSMDWVDISDERGFGIKINNFSYCISDEFAGLQISFDGDIKFPEAKQLLLELKSKVEHFSGYDAEIIEFYR